MSCMCGFEKVDACKHYGDRSDGDGNGDANETENRKMTSSNDICIHLGKFTH